jgi:hypothetical protein
MREDGRSKDECAQGVFDRLLILCDFCWWADVSMACGKADPRWRPVRKREPKWHSQGGGTYQRARVEVCKTERGEGGGRRRRFIYKRGSGGRGGRMECRASRDGEAAEEVVVVVVVVVAVVVEGMAVGQRAGRATQPLRLSYATTSKQAAALAVKKT